jgi:hypothetical protein
MLFTKLLDFKTYCNDHRTYTSREGRTPDTPVSLPITNLKLSNPLQRRRRSRARMTVTPAPRNDDFARG